ncbi:mycofactocin system FadH/OYE family oxidoreductase 1 [Pseudonocardia xinjiangensis]|uniref:mycofactocin system FadH/OYE family oxidoreductase 1 n=1 Tax=Pseudonocardia xinjiangensis TaxID=75289 RepID=UPI003D8EF31A
MPRLAGPVVLRGRTAPSRVLFGPHETNLAWRREISARHVAYYARRAAGGAGVIVTEVASVHGSDWPYERAPLAADAGPGWAAVAQACRPYGSLVLAGLGHSGGQGSSAYGQQALWAPSGVADPGTREVPMAVEQPEIDALVAGFAAAATSAVSAGLDGVEVAAGQHSILRQFLSGLTNRRRDTYGADRVRLLREVLTAVRAGLGADGVLGLRLCCDELAPWAGITPEQGTAVAGAVAGTVDYLVPVRGSGLSVWATRPDMHEEPGFNRGLCARVRTAVAVPVVLQGSVVDPAFAQQALDQGVADLVEMTRAQIAEPDLVRHVRAGTAERIRPCTLSNARSAVRDPRNPVVSDDAEPRAGHETEDPPVEGTDAVSRSAVVVGGGPAGMEAARVLALRGHRVRILERDGRLGGALRLAAAVPGRARMGLLVPWWERELARLGVAVELGAEADPALLDAADRAGEAVLLATGSRPAQSPIGGPAVLDAVFLDAAAFESAVLAAGSTAAVLARRPAGTVVVHDPVGDSTGVGIAEQVAAAGRAAVLVTPDQVAGVQLARTGDLVPANIRLQRAGVVRELRTRLLDVRDGRAVLEHVWTGARREIGCAVVIDCGHRLPADELWRARPQLRRAGDCVAPRTVHEAVLEGRRAAFTVGASG